VAGWRPRYWRSASCSCSRLVGRLILVQRMGRTRRSAKGAHAITGVFLVAAGIAYLQQTQWVVDLYNWVRGAG
jgi:hypothetical protein